MKLNTKLHNCQITVFYFAFSAKNVVGLGVTAKKRKKFKAEYFASNQKLSFQKSFR